MFISKKRYEEEKEFINRRMSDFENTLHELYAENLELKSKYNQLLEEVLNYRNDTSSRLDILEYDMSLRNGDNTK